jgi:DNA-binding MarR family transcriptional regulator
VAERQHAVKLPDDSLERTAAGNAFSDLVAQVLRLHGRLIAAGNAMARPLGQTESRWQVLAVIDRGPATVADIARVFGLARQSVQRTADTLAREGMARFEDNPKHQRAKLVRITRRGEAVLRRIEAAEREWADTIGEGFEERELRQAAELLGRVRHALGPQGPARAR